MPQVSVELGERSYVIDIAPGLLHSGRVAEAVPHTEIMVVTDDQVGPLYLDGLVAQLGHARVLTHRFRRARPQKNWPASKQSGVS